MKRGRNPNTNVVPYEDVRPRIRDGDILLYRGRSRTSRLIRHLTRSPYSHAGLAVWWNRRLMVMEAIGRGVIVTPLSSSISAYDGRVELFSTREGIPSPLRERIVLRAQDELGKEYALLGALLIGLRALLGMPPGPGDRARRERAFFCSQYVAHAYNAAGLDLLPRAGDRFAAPGDIACSPLLQSAGMLTRRSGKQPGTGGPTAAGR
ncbi:MAG: YiiX/YebB-like N1pC/P60 family cysteine hydrolase [Bacteroidota bacterium]